MLLLVWGLPQRVVAPRQEPKIPRSYTRIFGLDGTLVDFGGDIAVSRPREPHPWRVGIEAATSEAHQPTIALTAGGVATSGDSHRFLLRDGVRYSHILDPRTGWPVAHAPRAMTVFAQSCTQAGMMATLASLQGADAKAFLGALGAMYWIQR